MSQSNIIALIINFTTFLIVGNAQAQDSQFPKQKTLENYQLKLKPDKKGYALHVSQEECWFSLREGLLLGYLMDKGGNATIAEISRYTNTLAGSDLKKDNNPPTMTRKAVTSLNKKYSECLGNKLVEKITNTRIRLMLDNTYLPTLAFLGSIAVDRKSETAFLKNESEQWQTLELPKRAHQFLISVAGKLKKDSFYLFGDQDILPYSSKTKSIKNTFNYYFQLIEKEFAKHNRKISASSLDSSGFFIHIEGMNDEIRDTLEDPSGTLEINFFDRIVKYKKSYFKYPQTTAPLWYYLFPAKKKAFLTIENFRFLLPSFRIQKWTTILFRSIGRVENSKLPTTAQRSKIIALLHGVEAPNSVSSGHHASNDIIPEPQKEFAALREDFFEGDFCPFHIDLFKLSQVITIPEAGIARV